jgi:hypothetical protein
MYADIKIHTITEVVSEIYKWIIFVLRGKRTV